MSDILSIGTKLEFAECINWDETANIKDYEFVFVDLLDLEKRKDEFLHDKVPNEYKRQYELPDHDSVERLLTSGGNLIICLPTTTSVRTSENQDWEPKKPIPDDALIRPGTPILNFFSWLPFELEVIDEHGRSVDEDSIHEDWDWYFDNRFNWNLTITTRTQTVNGVEYEFQPLVRNRYSAPLAAEITVESKRGIRTTDYVPNYGKVYLLPLVKDGWSFDNLAEKVLRKFYPQVDLETTGRRPDWLSRYSAPREQGLKQEIEQLQKELDESRLAKNLLWEYDDKLEDAVRTALREAGLTVGDEVKNRRDGSIQLDDQVIMLEIKGKEGDMSEKNISQLQKWVDNNQDLVEKEVTGLLVINHQRLTDPEERRLQLDQERQNMLEDRGLQVVSSMELFKMVHGLEAEEITKDDVVKKLKSGEIVIEFDSVDSSEINLS